MDWLSGGWLTAFILAIFSVSVDGCQQASNSDAFSKSAGFGCFAPTPLKVEFDDTPIIKNAGEKVTVMAITSGVNSELEFDWEWSGLENYGTGFTKLPQFTFTAPMEEKDATYTVFVVVTDAEGRWAEAEKDVKILGTGTIPDDPDPENQPPVAYDQSLSTPFETAKSVALTGTDPDGDTLVITIDTPPSHGTLDGMGSNVVYTPNAEFSGLDNFTFRVSDGTASDTAVVSITVGEPDNPPQEGPTKVSLTAFTKVGGQPGETVLNANVEDKPVSVSVTGYVWDVGGAAFESDGGSCLAYYTSGNTYYPKVEINLSDGSKAISSDDFKYVAQ
jgi:hypothetical protein